MIGRCYTTPSRARREPFGLRSRIGAKLPDMPRGFRIDQPLIFFTLAGLVMVGPHVLPPTQISQVSSDPRDALIQLWNFWWTKRWLLHPLQNPYWTDLLYAPFGTSLAFAPYPLPYSVLSLPFQLLVPGVAGLALAFNAVVFGSFVLAGYGAYRLALHVTGHHRASLIAGLVYAFMPFHVLNMARLYLLCVEVMPFTVLALIRLWEEPSRRCALGLAIWLALAFYSSLEYALYLVLFAAFWLVYRTIAERGDIGRPQLLGLLQAGLLFLVLAAPLLVQQLRVSTRLETVPVERGLEEVVHWSPALLAYVTPSRVHPVYGKAMAFAGDYPDPEKWGMRSEVSLGWVALSLAGFGLARGRRGGRRFWVIAAAVFLVLSLGPQLRASGTWLTDVPLPYLALYELLPPLRGGRDPTRLVPFVMLLLSVLTAFGAAAILELIRNRRRQALVFAGLAALVLFEDLVAWAPSRVPPLGPVYSELAAMPDRAPIIDLTPSLRGMLAQTLHERPIGFVSDIALRGAPRREDFAVEQAFWMPRRVLGLPADQRAAEVERLRGSIRERGVSFVLFPASAIAERQGLLARTLGARLSAHGDSMLADFRSGTPGADDD
jgi:hypothetical protein